MGSQTPGPVIINDLLRPRVDLSADIGTELLRFNELFVNRALIGDVTDDGTSALQVNGDIYQTSTVGSILSTGTNDYGSGLMVDGDGNSVYGAIPVFRLSAEHGYGAGFVIDSVAVTGGNAWLIQSTADYDARGAGWFTYWCNGHYPFLISPNYNVMISNSEYGTNYLDDGASSLQVNGTTWLTSNGGYDFPLVLQNKSEYGWSSVVLYDFEGNEKASFGYGNPLAPVLAEHAFFNLQAPFYINIENTTVMEAKLWNLTNDDYAPRILINSPTDDGTSALQVNGTTTLNGSDDTSGAGLIIRGATPGVSLTCDDEFGFNYFVFNDWSVGAREPIGSFQAIGSAYWDDSRAGNLEFISFISGKALDFRPENVSTMKLVNSRVLIANPTDDTTSALQVNGTVTASSIVKILGTSAQFLKADGSVDSSTYLTSSNGEIAFKISQGVPSSVATSLLLPSRRMTQSGTITKVWIDAGTGPTGASLIVDINKNGTTIFTTQANRPTIADGQTSGNTTSIDIATFSAGDLFQIDIDQIGSTIAGQDIDVRMSVTY